LTRDDLWKDWSANGKDLVDYTREGVYWSFRRKGIEMWEGNCPLEKLIALHDVEKGEEYVRARGRTDKRVLSERDVLKGPPIHLTSKEGH